jgi:hypothetical protein
VAQNEELKYYAAVSDCLAQCAAVFGGGIDAFGGLNLMELLRWTNRAIILSQMELLRWMHRAIILSQGENQNG